MRPAASLCALVVAGGAAAAVVRPATVEQLAREADAVVRGRVERIASRWAPDRRHIVTAVTLRVARVLRGAAADRVTLLVAGGEVGEVGQSVDASPAFEEGEEAVVFLRRTPGGEHLVHGLAQGKFRVEGGEARPDLGNYAFVPGEVPRGERPAGRMPLEELERRVRAAR